MRINKMIEIDDNTFGSVWFESMGIPWAYSYTDNQYYIILVD